MHYSQIEIDPASATPETHCDLHQCTRGTPWPGKGASKLVSNMSHPCLYRVCIVGFLHRIHAWPSKQQVNVAHQPLLQLLPATKPLLDDTLVRVRTHATTCERIRVSLGDTLHLSGVEIDSMAKKPAAAMGTKIKFIDST